jgi:hypothetical protein
MDEYAFEILKPDGKGNWWVVSDNNIIKAYNQMDAFSNAEIHINKLCSYWRAGKIRLIKQYVNPDGEI